MFIFLYKQYFSRVVFDFIYLSESKIYIFINNLKLLGFQGDILELRLLFKHREKVKN